MVSSRIFHQMEIPHCALWPSRVLQRTNTQSCGIAAAAGYPLAQFGRRFGNAPPFPRVLETVPGAVRFTRNSLEKHDFSHPKCTQSSFFCYCEDEDGDTLLRVAAEHHGSIHRRRCTHTSAAPNAFLARTAPIQRRSASCKTSHAPSPLLLLSPALEGSCVCTQRLD
uniref:(northern house mosquito) hypothetical protein n=1 Tax=Culex pipiens TaxID=7175 RepID=A0A8D8MUS8_CULPI